MLLKDGLRKILKLCYRNRFFNLQSSKSSALTIQYGPLGSLLRRNVWKEWLSSINDNVDVTMFPIEVVKSENQLKSFTDSLTGSFLPDAFGNYFQTIPFLGTDSPCGFAVYGTCVNLNETSANSESLHRSSVLRNIESRYSLCVVFFCSLKKSSDWFNYWARYRYRWWRKFSSIPSKFSMSDVTESERSAQQISLLMEFPWGQESLETITMHKDNFFQNSCNALSLKPKENLSVAVIVCETELNLAAFAYLSNSFAEKWRDGQIRRLLQLHAKLAPYKVCILVRYDILDDLKALREVARHLEKELKKHRVTVYPYGDCFLKDETSHCNRYDEMGVPYTIVLDNKALNSGIVYLRNRDTTLEEQVHIAELTSKLLKYLHMKSFVDEF